MPTAYDLLLWLSGFLAGATVVAVGFLLFRPRAPRRFRFDCRIHPLPRRPGSPLL